MAQDFRGTSSVSIGRVPGLLRIGVIVDFDPGTLRVQVYIGSFKEYNAMKQDFNNIVSTQMPVAHFNALQNTFVGGYPENGTPVILGQGEGGQWFVLSILAKDPGALNTTLPSMPELDSGTYILQNNSSFIKLNKTEGIVIGEHGNSLTLDADRDVSSNTFDNNYTFSEAARTIEGLIRRDTFPNDKYASSLRETALDYNDTLKIIGLDPIVKENWSNVGSSIRNPARAEKREVIYEFGRSFNILDNQQEFLSYKDSKDIKINDVLNRRESRADALSLSLVSPNYLMETIKGTAVDIFGNILDINRFVIPLGQTEKLSVQKIKNNLQEQDPLGNVFENIKSLERREIAYHFELNAKKDIIGPPDVQKRDNFARERSRFFLDIDKEGLIKLNVPASSEIGNIPLLTRYENFSTVSPNEKTNDPNDLVFNDNSRDILLESFIGENGVVEIIDELNGNGAPIDRFSTDSDPVYIKHGTAYHNIAETLSAFSSDQTIEELIETTFMGRSLIPSKATIVSETVKISGDDANGGGRSGSFNFDGSLDINIGANTVDRHSLWADLQGAMIVNVGRDNNANNISGAFRFDGELLIQSGGTTPNNDERFFTVNNNTKAGCVDIRVFNSAGNVQVIRIDNNGIDIHSESRINVYSNGDMTFRSMGRFIIDGEEVLINSRKVRKEAFLGSI